MTKQIRKPGGELMLYLATEGVLSTEIEKLQRTPEGWEQMLPQILDLLAKVAIALVLIWVGRKIIILSIKALERVLQTAKVETTLRKFLIPAVRSVLHVFLIFFIVDFVGVPSSSILAILGSAGLAVGLALQGSLSNIAGGVLILLLKPFLVNDYIKEHAGGIEGTVRSIGLFYTTLMTSDNRIIVLPNGNLANSSISNFSQRPIRRVDLKVKVPYTVDLQETKKLLEEALLSQEHRCEDKEIFVFVEELEERVVVLGFRAWFPNEHYWKSKVSLLEKAKIALENQQKIEREKVT
jgi:small conductance mechanosensitive channel